MKHWFLGMFSTFFGWTTFREYARKCQQSGFMPRRSKALQFVVWYLSRAWLWIQVGKLTVYGRENLDSPGRLVFCPNHGAMLDAPVIFSVMKKQPRYMAAVEEMRGMGGLKAVLMGAAGAFPVDRGRGQTAVPPAVEALVNGEHIALFPEGKISNDGHYLKFKSGAARIAIAACDKRDHRVQVAIVPIQICYGRRDEATAGGPFLKMGFKWRGGVTVTIGKPIYIHNVEPLTPRNVTAVVRAAITLPECATSFLDDGDDGVE